MQGAQATLSVEDYARHFVKKIVKDEKYRDSAELHNAGTQFYSLLQRFAREGDREDVRTPFKIMKDEFMNEWMASSRDSKEELMRRLFSVLDIVHEECQNSVQNCVNGTEVSHTILEEFRLRLMKMVVGDTWKNALPLRIEALKHMHKYRNRELDGYYTQEARKKTLKHKARHLTVKKLKRSVVGPAKTSWTAVFNDLLLSSGARLAPLLFAILDENQAMEDHLLSISHPKGSDGFSHRGSMPSAKSGSSVSSSSIKHGSEAENSLPATDEETPYYFKSLNSELNAKLQLFKQKGLAHAGRAGDTSFESGDTFYRHDSSRHTEDDSTISRSDDFGSRELAPNEGHRSLTPFMDEPPPPWCQTNVQNQLAALEISDGLNGSRAPAHDPRIDALDDHTLFQCASEEIGRKTNESMPHQFLKSPSCNTNPTSAFPTQLPMNQPYRAVPQKPATPAEYDFSQLLPLDNLDPFSASKPFAFNNP